MREGKERITTAQVAALTGLSLRTVQRMMATGEIPGAARLGKRLTANRRRVIEWIAQQEQEIRSCPSTSVAMSGGASSTMVAAAIDEAYIRALSPKRQSA